ILFSVVLTALAFYLYFSWSKIDSVAQVQSAPLLIKAQELNQTIELDIQTLQRCLKTNNCSSNDLKLSTLKSEIDEFRSL
ncbi:hypothetical protein OS115_27980, partial [Klebsiella pneumoniae]